MDNREKSTNKFSHPRSVEEFIPLAIAKKRQYVSAAVGAVVAGTLVFGGMHLKDKVFAAEAPQKPVEPVELVAVTEEKKETALAEENLCHVQNEKFSFAVTPKGLVKIESFGTDLEQTYIIATENFEKCTNDFLANNSQKYSAFVNKFKMNITLDDKGEYRVTYSLPLVAKKDNERYITRIHLRHGNHKSLANGKNIFTDVEGENLQTTLIMNLTSPK